jgi:uncharacterized protein DUF6496
MGAAASRSVLAELTVDRDRAMAAKSSGRKYGAKASSKVKRAMHERKHGKLKSGRSGKKVKSRKQAIAIGLAEARRSGAKSAQSETKEDVWLTYAASSEILDAAPSISCR